MLEVFNLSRCVRQEPKGDKSKVSIIISFDGQTISIFIFEFQWRDLILVLKRFCFFLALYPFELSLIHIHLSKFGGIFIWACDCVMRLLLWKSHHYKFVFFFNGWYSIIYTLACGWLTIKKYCSHWTKKTPFSLWHVD